MSVLAALLLSSCRTEAQTSPTPRRARAGDEYRADPSWASLSRTAGQYRQQLDRMHAQATALTGVIAAKRELRQSTASEKSRLSRLRKDTSRVQRAYDAVAARMRLAEGQIKLREASKSKRK